MKSDAGRRGFTLIELVVVMVIMGITLSQILPRFTDFFTRSGSGTPMKQTMDLVARLKVLAETRNQDYLMHVEPLTGLIWVSRPGMTEEESGAARDKALRFTEDMELVDAVVLGGAEDDTHGITFLFSKKGYVRMGVIYFQDENGEYSLPIEPFLAAPRLEKGHILPDGCF